MKKLSADDVRKYFSDRLRGQTISHSDKVVLRCPFHDDRSPSLSVNLKDGVWFCHTGCGKGGLLDFEHKLNGGSREDARARLAAFMGADNLFESHKSKPTAIYQYTDAQGKLLFEKLRYEPKRFEQRRPDGAGGYVSNLTGITVRPLYRLCDLITANVVAIVEGEKDADRIVAAMAESKLAKVRFSATTNFDGAGKWKESYSPFFTGKSVIVLPDNDLVGKQHAEVVAKCVSKYALQVKVVNLSGLPEKGDVSDYLDKHPIAELLAEVKNTKPWQPLVANHEILVESLVFGTSAPATVDWLVDGIIQKGGNGIVIGEPKAGKSLAVLDLLLAVSSGTRWLNAVNTQRAKCALISREDFPGMTAQRIANLFRGTVRPMDFEGWLWVNTRFQTPTFLLEDEGQVSRLIDELLMEKVEFACFDVFRRLHTAEENDNTEMAKILAQLTRIQNEARCAIALVHHTNRDNNGSIFRRSRGATAIHGWTEWAIGVSVCNPEDQPSTWTRKVEFETKAACAHDPLYFKIESDLGVMKLNKADEPSQQPSQMKTGSLISKMHQ